MNTFLLLSDSMGIHIPSMFVDILQAQDIVNPEAKAIIPDIVEDKDSYWEAWDDLLALDWVFEIDGVKYLLHQDGDLWAIAEGEEDMFNDMLWEDGV